MFFISVESQRSCRVHITHSRSLPPPRKANQTARAHTEKRSAFDDFFGAAVAAKNADLPSKNPMCIKFFGPVSAKNVAPVGAENGCALAGNL